MRHQEVWGGRPAQLVLALLRLPPDESDEARRDGEADDEEVAIADGLREEATQRLAQAQTQDKAQDLGPGGQVWTQDRALA